MRLQKTVNSPTQLRIIQDKQGRDGANNKAQVHISVPQTTTHHPLLLPLTSSCNFHSPSSAQFSFFSLFPPPSSPPVHSRCRGNNTKRFSSQHSHRGNAWLSSRPLLEARRPPVHSSRLVLTTVESKLRIRWNLLEC